MAFAGCSVRTAKWSYCPGPRPGTCLCMRLCCPSGRAVAPSGPAAHRALLAPSGLADRPVGPCWLLVAPSGLTVGHRAARMLTVDGDATRPQRVVLAVVLVAAAVLVGEPLHE
eukprot:1115226-Prymnesium_polylepis.1